MTACYEHLSLRAQRLNQHRGTFGSDLWVFPKADIIRRLQAGIKKLSVPTMTLDATARQTGIRKM